MFHYHKIIIWVYLHDLNSSMMLQASDHSLYTVVAFLHRQNPRLFLSRVLSNLQGNLSSILPNVFGPPSPLLLRFFPAGRSPTVLFQQLKTSYETRNFKALSPFVQSASSELQSTVIRYFTFFSIFLFYLQLFLSLIFYILFLSLVHHWMCLSRTPFPTSKSSNYNNCRLSSTDLDEIISTAFSAKQEGRGALSGLSPNDRW